ncbi:MAG TPA: HepT-like ribonuclease domain-containing protein [Thermoanaerobaculia bacterium]|nr:HepT-like ribonuclease domain-containing protein [Thermoanaerobaculia bacterium]
MRLEAKKLLFDVVQAARLVQRFTENRSFEDYVNDPMLRSAVERQFEIMGEAIGKLAKTDPLVVERVPDYRRVISFRNVLIHGYDVVLDEVVWGVVETKLPELLKTIEELLSEE